MPSNICDSGSAEGIPFLPEKNKKLVENKTLRASLQEALIQMLRDCKRRYPNKGKLGKIFQGEAERQFPSFGLPCTITTEDAYGAQRVNRAGAYLWRLRRTGEPAPAPGSSRIDLVVRGRHGDVVALIEVESDIDDVRNPSRNGDKNYFVQSIARNGDGHPFNSYHSIERMAIACATLAGMETSITALESIASNDPADHNPMGIPLYLVNCAGPQASLLEVLQPRLRSLGVSVVN